MSFIHVKYIFGFFWQFLWICLCEPMWKQFMWIIVSCRPNIVGKFPYFCYQFLRPWLICERFPWILRYSPWILFQSLATFHSNLFIFTIHICIHTDFIIYSYWIFCAPYHIPSSIPSTTLWWYLKLWPSLHSIITVTISYPSIYYFSLCSIFSYLNPMLFFPKSTFNSISSVLLMTRFLPYWFYYSFPLVIIFLYTTLIVEKFYYARKMFILFTNPPILFTPISYIFLVSQSFGVQLVTFLISLEIYFRFIWLVV